VRGGPSLTPPAEPGPASVRVAVDAMGGDHAPDAIVRGSLLALERLPSVAVDLVGDEARVRAALDAAGGREGPRLAVVHASQVLGMDEHVGALRTKTDTSVARAVGLVREGRAGAIFSAGNTGGVVAAATMGLERVKGIKRPGIAAPFPTRKGPCLVIDVGANIYCKPVHLLHYAHMAAAYARAAFGVAVPRVGLLNIGEEEGKGTGLVQETTALLRGSGLHFVGNVEGHLIFQGVADVVVCEGFVGNVVLKTTEGLAEAILAIVMGAAKQAIAADPAAARTLESVLGGLRTRMDYASYGGAPLLGFEGTVLIGHGRSSPEAVANAIKVAVDCVARDVGRTIREAAAVPAPEVGTGGGAPDGAGRDAAGKARA
jgi:glycerol-3-phosphate acyltransferase PlsX